MSDSDAPGKKHHDWPTWVALLITIGGTWFTIAASWAVLHERVETLTTEYTDHETRIRDIEKDSRLADQIGQLRIEITELKGDIKAMRSEQPHDRRER